jgi:hypothetical protein
VEELIAASVSRDSGTLEDTLTCKQPSMADQTKDPVVDHVKESHNSRRARKLAKPVYHLLKDSQIKKLLRDLNLSTKGTRQVKGVE